MTVYFYSPFVNANRDEPSGAARMAGLLINAIKAAGYDVCAPDLPRTYNKSGDATHHRHTHENSRQAALQLLSDVRSGVKPAPRLWVSYHVYYKSPDWIGPLVCEALSIPYVVVEGSYAPKRLNGPWHEGHVASTEALKHASGLLAMTDFDRVCLERISAERVFDFKPFIEVPAEVSRVPHDGIAVAAAGMMRNARKLESYRLLAETLANVAGPRLAVHLAGDGPLREDIETFFRGITQHDVKFHGALRPAQVFELFRASDILVWPGIGEAYGLVFLEAQAAGLPVVACRNRGVGDVVLDGQTALLTPPGDVHSLAQSLNRFVDDAPLRNLMSQAAKSFVRRERSLEAASQRLKEIFEALATS